MNVEAVHLGKRFGSRVAVDDLSFTLEPGSITGFLGPNGAGKTTTLRLMLGLARGSGQTLFAGKSLSAYRPGTPVVGCHLQPRAFHPKRRARAHLDMLGRIHSVSPQRIDEVLAEVGLTDVANQRAGGFSLGMAQRLGLAAAILARPPVLFLDEPMNGLDAHAVYWFRTFLRSYADQGHVVFVSSHLMSEMQLLADRVIIIARGRLVADEKMETLLQRYGKPEVLARADDNGRLVAELHRMGIAAHLRDDGFVVADVDDTGIVATAATTAAVKLLELRQERSSLEQVYLELTAQSQEFVPSRSTP
ncbi:ABC transporter ATP-binding protein [Acidothermus cellulolyticus]|jgi:ABC-2 type transport system ATP-binding protein|nr:ATP-binding cassette domain-containing protein [Acidothermus cellulolyticus]